MKNLFNFIFKTSIYLLVFLLPLFFLPFSFEAFEFNKQYLLFFLVSIAFFNWLAKMVLVEKEIKFKWSPLDIFVFTFLFIAVFSTIFSVDKNSSLFGFYGRFSNGLISLFSLVVFYFLITNNLKTEKGLSAERLLKLFFISVFFVVLFSYFSIFGLWPKINTAFGGKLLPLMLQNNFNPISGSLEGLAIFLSVVTVLLTSLILFSKFNFKQFFSLLFLFFILGLLAIIDFQPAWFVLLVSLVFFLVFALLKRVFRENVNRLLLPIFLIIISAIFLFINPVRDFLFSLPQELILGQKISWQVAFWAATENIKSGFLGLGMGNFFYDFNKFKPIEFNQSPLWSIRFDRPGSHWAEIFGTMGFLGLISYLALIGIFFIISWFLLQAKVWETKNLSLLVTFLALVISQFFYYQNTVLAFFFWLVLGLSVASWQKPIKEKTFSFKDFPELSLAFNAFLILIGLAILGSYFFAIRFYLADFNYLSALNLPFNEERIKRLERAVSLNPFFPQYRLILARDYLTQVLEEARKPVKEQDGEKIQKFVSRAINQARTASQIFPNNVNSFETLAMIYREIQPLAQGATDWAIRFFEESLKLEPKNPLFYTEIAKLYLVKNDIEKAKENLVKAKELKPDYFDLRLQEALIFEKEKDIDQAIKIMEGLVEDFPLNVEVRFQLGRLYFNKDRIEDAISQFENAILIFPNHSNSLYALGLAYSKKGEKEKAISVFEKVLELNPGNQDVIQKLEELKK